MAVPSSDSSGGSGGSGGGGEGVHREFHPVTARPRPEVRRTFIVACVSVFLFTPLAWMISDRDPPYLINGVTIEPREPTPESQVTITFHITRGRGTCGAGVIYREFLQVKDLKGIPTRRLFVYDPVTRAVPPDISTGDFTRTAVLPSGLQGEAMYRATACYPCNLLQRWLSWPVCVDSPDVFFIVK